MLRRLLTLGCTGLLLLPQFAQAWWETGHQVTARIAASHLTAAARTRLADILEVEDTPEAIADALANVSTWADQVKTETDTGSWHFINLTLQDSRANFGDRCTDDNCVTARIHSFAAQLKANETSDDAKWSDLDALRFLVHFVGDIHQPLHAASDADLGGNCEKLDAPVGTATNLHALWDGALVDTLGDSVATIAGNLETEIQALNADEQSSLAQGDVQDWAWESHRLALVNIYKRLRIPKEEIAFPASCSEAPSEVRDLEVSIDTAYAADMQPVVKQQLIRGGLRLAKLLNDVLGS